MIKDYYHLLGLPRYARLSEVKTAYRRLVAQYHPDKLAALGPEVQQEANAKMLELNEAMALLSDPVRRAQYHEMLELIPERLPREAPPPGPVEPVAEEPLVEPEPLKPTPSTPEPEARRGLLREEQMRNLKEGLKHLPLKWREIPARGWTLALEATDMRRSVLVVQRHLETLSLLSVRSVKQAVATLVEERKLTLRPTAIIALVSYDRLMDAQVVQEQLQETVAGRRGWLKTVNPLLLLRDGNTQRSLLLGTLPEDAEVRRVVQYLARGPNL